MDGVKLMTFGQPRIGNAAFASYFKKYLPHAIRVTNAHDIVPHLPPYFSFFPQKTYHHFPREVCYTSKQNYNLLRMLVSHYYFVCLP
jgi:hypothetical protein